MHIFKDESRLGCMEIHGSGDFDPLCILQDDL